ncbi:transcription factor MYB87 [Brachypodium distachyon]|uniref:Uncharacterized protein n=1 Tax=Brachypodium distachyon TaxID=15368 RepID=A0A2K2D0I4_BRADI|nr:transcription factor MYB87 [Brachypodium distachyon]PNT67784.1 hypothetical protein BRADI_3g32170v3 [Brachypodium distachyon]|eukprot:XP_014756015.1 transcription factor MYB87 [Brachypodium distachyon]
MSWIAGLQRCGRSCRSRWLNYLRPGLKHGHFTLAEETIILEMYSKRGSCWSVIATQLPGRTDLAVKNYWNSTLAKRLPGARTTARRRRSRPSSSTTSDARKPDEIALVAHDDESATTGSPCHATVVEARPLLAAATVSAVKEEVSGAARAERKPAVARENAPPRRGDQAGAMDMVCAPASPMPLAIMEPDLPWLAGFDEIDSFLPWFDDW